MGQQRAFWVHIGLPLSPSTCCGREDNELIASRVPPPPAQNFECAGSSPSSAATYVGPPAAMRAPLRNYCFSCCANRHRTHAHVVPSSFEPDLIVSRFSRTMTALLLTKRCRHP